MAVPLPPAVALCVGRALALAAPLAVALREERSEPVALAALAVPSGPLGVGVEEALRGGEGEEALLPLGVAEWLALALAEPSAPPPPSPPPLGVGVSVGEALLEPPPPRRPATQSPPAVPLGVGLSVSVRVAAPGLRVGRAPEGLPLLLGVRVAAELRVAVRERVAEPVAVPVPLKLSATASTASTPSPRSVTGATPSVTCPSAPCSRAKSAAPPATTAVAVREVEERDRAGSKT